jgi:hypothetical protein
MLVHTVYFWLKPNLSEENLEFFFKEVKTLKSIPSVIGFYCGKPASTPPRPVLDQSYDCGLTVILEDIAGHDAYQIDPIHKDFIEKCSPLWDKVKIYDAV